MYFHLPDNYFLVMTVRLDYITFMLEVEYRYEPLVNTTRVIRDILPLAIQYHVAKLSRNKYVLEAALKAITLTDLIGMTFNDIIEHVIKIDRMIINSGYLDFNQLSKRYYTPDSFIFDFDDSDNAKVLYIYEYFEPKSS